MKQFKAYQQYEGGFSFLGMITAKDSAEAISKARVKFDVRWPAVEEKKQTFEPAFCNITQKGELRS